MNNELTNLIYGTFFPYSSRSLERIKRNNIKFAYYTSVDTGFKIIEHENIWMRNVRCMNDYSEVAWGKDVLFSALDDSDTRKRLNLLFAKLSKDAENFDEFFKRANNSFFKDMEKRTYITCLSEHDENDEAECQYGRLSMWRAYGRDNGVALIINTNFMENDQPIDWAFFITTPILYEGDVKKYLSEILTKMEDNLESLVQLGYEEIRGLFLRTIYFAILSIKHPSFKEEREWRIILSFFNDQEQPILKDIIDPDYQTIDGIPQKIFKINLKDNILYNADIKSLLNQVIIGPTGNPEIIKEAFEGLLAEKQIAITEDLVHISDVPLRK